jgi:four helix bundle protein
LLITHWLPGSADDLFIKLHLLSLKQFPSFELGLGAQLRRAAFSVAANIVEGFAREKGRARVNFLTISRASLAEVGYCIHVARRLGYVSDVVAGELETQIKQVGAPLAGLIRSERLVNGAEIVGAVLLALLAMRLL